MAYWGDKADECDYAFNVLGSYITYMRDAMFAAARGTIDEQYPEQSIVVTLKTIRVLWEAFPKNVVCTFHRGDFEKSKLLFHEWLTAVGPQLSSKRRQAVISEAESVFNSCEDMYRSL